MPQNTDRNGRVRTFDYDELNRQLQEVWWNGATAIRTSQFSWDAASNLLTAADPDGSYAYTYDDLNRVVTVDNSGTPGMPAIVLTYGYDAVGNVLSVGDNLGTTVASRYDARDLLVSRDWAGGGDPIRIDFTYNLRGDRTGIERFSDLAGTQLIGSSAAAFDALGQMTDLEHRDAVDAVFADYDYDYDLAGQMAQEIVNGETSTYSHDAIGQLLAAAHAGQTDESYSFDENGNRIGGSYVVGPNNQVISDSLFTYVYDNEGNLQQKTEVATGHVTTLTFDWRNRLIAVVEKTAGGLIVQEVSYTYDVFDRRIAKTVNGQTLYTVYENTRVALPNQVSPCERDASLSRV